MAGLAAVVPAVHRLLQRVLRVLLFLCHDRAPLIDPWWETGRGTAGSRHTGVV